MPTEQIGLASAHREPDDTARFPYERRGYGKTIRRQLERRFDAILLQISRGDPEQVRQAPAARWLLDNSHLVRQALQQIATDLPRAYARQLPAVGTETGKTHPRIFELIENAVSVSSLPIDCDAIAKVCSDHNPPEDSAACLTLGELWAVPIGLRITLLWRLCEAADLGQTEIRDAMPANDQSADVAVIAGCISSLQTVATYDWPTFVERCSVVERTLEQDPVAQYRRMDFATRDRYRGEIERIAARSVADQSRVAQVALELAQRAKQESNGTHRQHIGFYLVDEGRQQLEAAVQYRASLGDRCKRPVRAHNVGLYLLSILGLAVWGSVALLFALLADDASRPVSVAAALIALIPLLSVSSGAINFLLSLSVAPRQLAKLDFANGVPVDQQSIVVVPMMLSSTAEIADNLSTLEQNYLGNADPTLSFALLSDFLDATSAETAADQPLLDQAIAGIDALNTRYASGERRPFLLFHRRRLWNEKAQCWMGWERKRGKLEEFNELLRGATDTSYVLQHGNGLADVNAIRYVITLDADSYLPTGTAARLIGTMAHPLNQPRFDPQGERVLGGYTVIQPRLEINPVTSADTGFARVFAGDVMLDLYTHAVSDVYQDLFGEAVFAGKGIYNLDAFRRSVADKVPTNAVLSHDLLEGLLGRAGLASDIVVLENYPSNYLAYLKRLHRWVRGDWQLLPWLCSDKPANERPFRPGLIGRWKLFDNLRRSLVTPAILALLLLGWLALPGNPVAWTLLFALFPGLPILLRITLAFRTSLWRWGTIASSARNLLGHAGADAARWLLALVFLPAEAFVVVDAALRTLYRVTVSRRRLLEWSTAAQVSRDLSQGRPSIAAWRMMWFGPVLAAVAALAVIMLNPQALTAAAVLLLTWACSPLIAWHLGRQIDTQTALPLTETDALFLRSIARDTWRFFERFVGPETQWLPPDNVQESPTRTIAERTSPTNIGMMLLSTLSAYDFGYLGQRQLLTRLASHLHSINALAKYRGHLFNWYATRTLTPLEPRYVSTVDSGNLVAALITLRQALRDLPHNAHALDRTVKGLADELFAMRRQLFPTDATESVSDILALTQALDAAQAALSDTDRPLATAKKIEKQYCNDIEQAFLQALPQHPDRWSVEEIANFRENAQVFRQRIRSILSDIELFAPWSERILSPPSLCLAPKCIGRFETLSGFLSVTHDAGELRKRFSAAIRVIVDLLGDFDHGEANSAVEESRAWLEALQHEVTSALSAVQTLDGSREDLISDINALIRSTDFTFLYDDNRNLFRVGYDTSTGEADTSYYDLLASEARIASFVAIAKGDVPAKHWLHLGRPLTRIRGLRILLSWSATAFEYLMPRLIMHSPASGLLNQSCEGAVKEQIRFGEEYGIPWGVSESGYAQFDAQNHYQYFAFGIPKLGLKWDQGERLVVSSYSCVLALPFAPMETVQNLRQLIRLRASGHYGFYEALDFGDAHKPRPPRPRIVQSYMAHHQGMILVALGNALHNNEMPRRFHQDPYIASVEHLLYERLPQRMQTRPLERLPSPLKELAAPPATVTQWQVDPEEPELAVLSNGRLSSRISAQGGSALYWRGMAATRWDPIVDGPLGGTCFYLKDLDNNRLRSLGGVPLPNEVDVLFAPHSAEFRAHRKNMLLRMSITVAPSDDVEIRRITITNDSHEVRRVMLCAYSEPVLGEDNADRRHPAFSKLFIEPTILDDQDTVLFRRRPREADRPSMYLAQTAIVPLESVVSRGIEVDRGAFFGRDAERSKPVALIDPSYQFDNVVKSNLDPCSALAVTLDIPPRSTLQCAFLSAVGDSRASALNALRPFQSLERIAWTVEAARLQSERELTGLRLDSDNVRAAYQLLSKLLWPRSLPHLANDAFRSVRRVQDSLWRHGISGDRAIVTLRVDDDEDLQPATSVLQSLSYLSRKDFALDAVFLDETKGGYTFPTNDRLRKLIERYLAPGRERNGAAAFIVPVRNLAAEEKSDLIAAARVFIDPQAQTIGARLKATDRYSAHLPALVPQPSAPLSDEVINPVALADNLLFNTPLGGMQPDFNGYTLLISKDSRTPAPWCNVLANPDFGTLVSESGSMCTWWGNSSENRLTPWNNDPVLDRTGEAIYVRDEETGEHWSLTPQPRATNAPYLVTHGIGSSVFENNSHGLEQQLQIFVDPEEPLKFLRVQMTNRWPRNRRLTVTFAVEWLLGNSSSVDHHLLLPERDSETGALLVRNGFIRNSNDELAFVSANLDAHGVSAHGAEFFGRRRSWSAPEGLAAVGLSNRVEPSAEPCAIYQVHIDLQADETRDFHFVLGAAENRAAADDLIGRARNPSWVDGRQQALRTHWSRLLDRWQVKTPDIAADAMINRWLLYQVFSSRLWGRIGFYQASGGFGYRDQLQDVLAVLDVDPVATRAQILIAATRQFEEGDVLHWWHESPLRGVRTRCSDDLLWLPYAVAEYIDVMDDASILHDTANFLHGEPLGEHELERYAEYHASPITANLYEHCCRAIDARLTFGKHGMPFIGTGDWNDGLNRVGEKGQGESVWMAWFLVVVCRRFAPLCRTMDDNGRADHYESIATELLQRTQSIAWDGDWYIRGYFDDGTPLGASGDAESEIDLNAQTWAVLADPDDPAARQAMQAVEEKLIDVDHRIIKLLAPPFENTIHDPGYIRSYPPGVRENGGQYTHAAVWAAWAAVELGDADTAMRWFEWLNPLNRASNDADIAHYRLEPYVTPGDVYGVDTLAGRGGWSWYTGSAAWLYRLAIRRLLGLQRRGAQLFVRPCLPQSWPLFEVTLRHEQAEYRLRVHDPSRINHDELFVLMNGSANDTQSIALENTGRHDVEVFAGATERQVWQSEQRHRNVSMHPNDSERPSYL